MMNFKSKAAYNRWLAYGHSRTKTGLKVGAKSGRVSVFKATPGNQAVSIRGKPIVVSHKVKGGR